MTLLVVVTVSMFVAMTVIVTVWVILTLSMFVIKAVTVTVLVTMTVSLVMGDNVVTCDKGSGSDNSTRMTDPGRFDSTQVTNYQVLT